MPDYSDEEIDKVSDDVSESDEVLIDGKPVKNKLKDLDDNSVCRNLSILNIYLSYINDVIFIRKQTKYIMNQMIYI